MAGDLDTVKARQGEDLITRSPFGPLRRLADIMPGGADKHAQLIQTRDQLVGMLPACGQPVGAALLVLCDGMLDVFEPKVS